MVIDAAGQPKIVKNPVHQDVMFKASVASEENARKLWKTKWGWILDEYEAMRKQLEAKLKSYTRPEDRGKQQELDLRTIFPVPATVNHQYGWISIKPEFVLERYGPDVNRGRPLPKEYFIFKF